MSQNSGNRNQFPPAQVEVLKQSQTWGAIRSMNNGGASQMSDQTGSNSTASTQPKVSSKKFSSYHHEIETTSCTCKYVGRLKITMVHRFYLIVSVFVFVVVKIVSLMNWLKMVSASGEVLLQKETAKIQWASQQSHKVKLLKWVIPHPFTGHIYLGILEKQWFLAHITLKEMSGWGNSQWQE